MWITYCRIEHQQKLMKKRMGKKTGREKSCLCKPLVRFCAVFQVLFRIHNSSIFFFCVAFFFQKRIFCLLFFEKNKETKTKETMSKEETTPVVVAETPQEATPEPAAPAADPAAETTPEEEHHFEKLFIRGLAYTTRELTLARFIETVAPVFVSFLFFFLSRLIILLHVFWCTTASLRGL